MNYLKLVSKSSSIVLSAVVCTALVATDASAQRRGGGQGGSTGQGRSAGQGRNTGQGRSDGRAVPRGPEPRGGVVAPRTVSPRVIVRAPYRPYYYGPRFSLGFYAGYPYYYGYPYGYYGYPYAYGGYGGYYGYPGYAYRGYGYPLPPAGYDYGSGDADGGVKIQGAPPDAQVFADGYYVGIADDFDGALQHLNLTAGAHSIEIRMPGQPPVGFDVNVQPGRTVTIHVR
jgi:hypothetical protein